MGTKTNPEGAPSLSRSLRQGGGVDFKDPPPLTTKRRGEIAEAAFLHKAASLGFSVAKPWGDSDRYDFIVEAEGLFSRVQVKTASCVSKGAYSIHACGCVHTRVYTAAEIDFLVAYIVSAQLWYILPVSLFTRIAHVKLHPFREKPLSRYEIYREAWDSMRNAALLEDTEIKT
ncbi:MAG TPA: group I intron-associated PD-(D/E)XK endonuclease [Terriglobales bacterium]|nr:group I intron-associated PD-(D/E)XK endonuclease [Terriglobales bacterium]